MLKQNLDIMTQSQTEHALKVMYEEIKKLRKRVDDLEKVLSEIYHTDNDGYTKRNYHGVDNYINR